jgi:GT2 family glycosyltransferase
VIGEWDIVVVDNGSVDGTPAAIRSEFAEVRVVEAGENIGFGAANNRAAALASGEWLFLLNPDTTVVPGALEALLDAARRRSASVVAPRLVWPDGRYQNDSAERRLPAFWTFISEFLMVHRFASGGGISNFDPDRAGRLEQPIAAALLVRRDVFEQVGGFDERFHPIWFEDVDLCKRLLEAGHEIWYEPTAVIRHARQHSLPLFTTTAVQAMINANAIRYGRKHFSPAAAATMRVLAVIGVLARGVLRTGRPRTAAGHFALAWRMARHSDESRWYR